ncbi:MAG: CRISPR-associated protein [Ignavibacteriae bacterium]|nr:MAG: CRISPR-associated protein [Ignavibacteriota bacterium]
MLNEFKNRVFGCIIVKSINSNFNADFTHHPRTLPDGVVYSTDKALKFSVKDYLRKMYPDDRIFYVKRYNEKLNPFTLDETYKSLFGEYSKAKIKNKDEIKRIEVLDNLMKCTDVRLFGATFAGEANISIHGVVQINHGVNRFAENDIYTEDILSPFRNPGEEGSDEKAMSTIGNQTNLKEGHYVFHFSINPKNTMEFYKMINNGKEDNKKQFLSTSDIDKLREAFNNSVTALDSSRKIGSENEAMIWIQLNESSKKMLPSLTELVNVNENRELDFSKVYSIIRQIETDIEKIEVFYNPVTTIIKGLTINSKIKHYNILNNQEITVIEKIAKETAENLSDLTN